MVAGLRGDDLALNTSQTLLRLDQGQTQTGDPAKAIRPTELQDVATSGLTIDPRSNQSQDPLHSESPSRSMTNRSYRHCDHPPNLWTVSHRGAQVSMSGKANSVKRAAVLILAFGRV